MHLIEHLLDARLSARNNRFTVENLEDIEKTTQISASIRTDRWIAVVVVVVVVELPSHVPLCDPIDCSMPSLPVPLHLPELPKFMSIELVVPSNHLILCHPLLLLPSIFTSIRVFSRESAGQSSGASASASVYELWYRQNLLQYSIRNTLSLTICTTRIHLKNIMLI